MSTAGGLRIRDLRIEYSSGGYVVRPIDALDLDVESGQLVLLLGASGCGKTTLLSALAAILKPAGGSIRFDDVEVSQLSGDALTQYRRHRVGIVFQAFNLVPSLTALENVAAPMWAGGTSGREARRRSAELLERVGLSDRVKHRPGDLSGGQQQRVAIARALAYEPPLLLADEPTAHLDYVQVDGVLRLLREVASPGRVVVVATHDERMIPLADRVVELSPRVDRESRPPERRELDPGDVLFAQGEPGDLVYTVDDGEIELVRQLSDGGEEFVAGVKAGGYFGELAPLFGLRRSATARARVHTVVTGYTPHDFRQLVGVDRLAALISGS
ncbi:MAG: ATP-binding cassette domain-containing protein [Actinobacteria bacterium]|nr:MAG: ATP-binding cassette domain-containing protein [Actinomycetota bacterium]